MSTSEPQQPVATDIAVVTDATVAMISQVNRLEYDAAVREISGVDTPAPLVSEAFQVETDRDVAGFAYVQLAYHVSPWVIVEGAPADTLRRLTDAITEHLRTLLDLEPAGDDRILTYDIYIPSGSAERVAPPEGFERLPIEVWRKRVI